MRLRDIFEMWRRILIIAEKPEADEYKLILKITLAGILLVGVIGFLIHLALTIVQGGV
ncbi:MAG: protein translocase SEC61 complex subunit gamma [Thermoprotei archaeon]|nr:MAG: protein translocase SEC61 complex subunit gamma [Thermoprotei archaeon]HDN75727.1 protein translocase SEC61 complex subunit gamma [Acidilobales archaeon]